MPVERWRVERILPDGTRVTVTIEGKVTSKKVQQLLDLFEILAPTSTTRNTYLSPEENEKSVATLGLKPRISSLIINFFSNGRWFKSKEIQKLFEEVYSEKTKLSTVSTYLSRLFYSGLLERRGSRAEREYRIRDLETLKSLVTNYS
ncbi:MAG: hypothetical protein QXK12_02390 [Candidatus Nezhaarchaeales archaeon]